MSRPIISAAQLLLYADRISARQIHNKCTNKCGWFVWYIVYSIDNSDFATLQGRKKQLFSSGLDFSGQGAKNLGRKPWTLRRSFEQKSCTFVTILRYNQKSYTKKIEEDKS